jgi:CRISPR/Cas system-associated exonuclease Cas4 (RecB family)
MPGPIRVSKRVFLGARVCFTQAWFLRHLPPQEPSIGDKLRIDEGREIGEWARRVFAGGVLVDERNLEKAAAMTADLMADPKVRVIFEATFLASDYVAKADILIREKEAWDVIEVKSNLNLKDELIADLAYTVKVLSKAGVSVRKAQLMLLSPEYRRGMSDGELFQVADQTAEALEMVEEFEAIWDEVPRQIKLSKPPTGKHIWGCRSCEYFETDCVGKAQQNHIFDLLYLEEAAFDRLLAEGITSIADIPKTFSLSSTQDRVRAAVKSGRPIIDREGLSAKLKSVKWPAYYLDFETVKTAVPVLDELAPHEALLTQYSIHIRKSPKHECEHREYLAQHDRDCRLKLATRLVRDLGKSGSIVVYSGYERRMLKELAELFPELEDGLLSCVDRLFDLQKVFTEYFYHPGFAGSTSIKVTLPILTELKYDDLKVQGGDDASAHFAQMMRGEIVADEIEGVRGSLLEYCKRDTLAMVSLHDSVLKHCVKTKQRAQNRR